MEDKQYGVQIHLIEQLKRFQISLKRKRKRMAPFVGHAHVIFNGTGARIRRNIQAENGILSIIPFPLLSQGLNGFHPPRQTLISLDSLSVRIDLDIAMNVTIIFDTAVQKEDFVTRLGDLNLSEQESSSSRPPSSGSTDREP